MSHIPNRRLWERVESDPGAMRRIDPLRWAVQATLALYLLPVLLLVLLIGGLAMIAGGVAHVLRKVGLALDGSALAGSGAVRTRTRADSGPHYLRKKEYGMKDRSA
jgi:predicted acyltransferase